MAMMGLWLDAGAKVGGSVEAATEYAQLRSTASAIAGALDSACLMGAGNARELEVRAGAGGAMLEVRGRDVFLVGQRAQAHEEAQCEVESVRMAVRDGDVLAVGNDAGRLTVAGEPQL